MKSPRILARLAQPRTTSPTFLLAAWFAILLTIGAVLLALPVSHREGGPEVTALTAFFTAVSAFCVTGLVIVDTPAAFSTFGQGVILVLIELGGVGVMSFAALGFSIMGRRLSLTGRAALADALFQNSPILELRAIFRSMFKAVLLIQVCGAALLYKTITANPPLDPLAPDPLWSAVFHSVSAFCNAGFSIYHDNLTPEAHNPLFLAVVMTLVVSGGLGHGVLAELYRLPGTLIANRKAPHLLSPNTRVVLLASGALIVAGALLVGISDRLFAPGGGPGVLHSLFHSVVSRTAGFNTAPIASIPLPTCLLLCLLMFVGGAPGSCAGGIKITSAAIWLARIRASLRQSADVNVMGYSVPKDLLTKSRVIIALSCLWVIFGVLVLAWSEPDLQLETLLFEQVSALATVGFSMGITPRLNCVSQIWLILSMIMGKFGPLTVALWMVTPSREKVRGPEARFMIG